MENKKPYVKQERNKLLEPAIYPPLKRQYDPLKIEKIKYNDIGRQSIKLLREQDHLYFKKIYVKDINGFDVSKPARNTQLKLIAVSNDEYFPKELTVDKYIKVVNTNPNEKFLESIKKAKLNSKKPKNNIIVNNNLGRSNDNELKKNDSILNNHLNLRRKQSLDIIELPKTKEQEIAAKQMEDNESVKSEEEQEVSEEYIDYENNHDMDDGDNDDEENNNYNDEGEY